MRKIHILLAIFPLLASCTGKPDPGLYGHVGPIYPDYMGVTVPVGIAPLNFDYTSPASRDCITTFTAGDMSVVFKGGEVRWNARRWAAVLDKARGGDITVKSTVPDTVWTIHVSSDPIDYGLDYRLIEPGYEVYSLMGIYERNLGNFKERALLENTDFMGCVNCHEYNAGDPDEMSLHIRGQHGATIILKDGEMEAFNTKTDSTLGFCVYPYWHCSGDYIVYSTNNTHQSFHVQQDKLVEVFDLASDLQVYDVRNNCLITAPQVKRPEMWETFPSFSPDGRTIYFCSALERSFPEETTSVRYALCKVSFDPETGTIGDDIQVLVDAPAMAKSISFPKPSYDGRYIMYALSDYGNFSIWHHEADLWLLDLETGESRPLDEVNSPDTESYHNWSSNSRWFVFSSRRDDGLFTRPYIAHIGEDGAVGKPFMLPQEDPRMYYSTQFRSFNVPEFVTGPVKLDKVKARRMISSPERTDFGFRWSD